MRHPLWLLLLALAVASCAGAPPAPETSADGDPAELRVRQMVELESRIRQARARSKLGELQQELEKAADSKEPWAVVVAAFAQMPGDADGAWNRLRSVVTVLGGRGEPAYWAHLGMSDVYVKWDLADQAKGEVDKALQLYPNTSPALARMGAAQLAAGSSSEAKASYEAALERAGGAELAPSAALALAKISNDGGHLEKARAYLEQLLEAHPQEGEALILAADLTEDPAEAIGYLERGVDAMPENTMLLFRLANSLDRARRPEEALSAWKRLAEVRPSQLDAWRAQTRLARTLGKREDEVAAWKKILELDTDDVEGFRRLAELHLEAGEMVEAEEALDEALSRRADDGDSLLARARIRRDRTELRLAIADFREAKRLGAEGAEADLKALESEVGLPETPVAGKTGQAVYNKVADVLAKAYAARLKEVPGMSGTLTIRVWVSQGAVEEAELVEDTVHDPKLGALAFWLVKDARFPSTKSRQEFTLPFTLDPPRR